MPEPQPLHPATLKTAVRDQVLTARRRRPLLEVRSDAEAVAAHVLALPEVRRAATVACYVAVGTEPGTGALLEGLRARGTHVLLPRLLPDDDLDWARYAGPDALVSARRGLLEPAGEGLGPAAVAGADVVVVPGVAVDRTGLRLGRGGGSYDRALGRVPVGTPVLVLLYDDEVLDRVPGEPHDRRVSAAVTPSGVHRF